MSNLPQKTGVIVVDVQGDFTEAKDGSLAVSGTDITFIDTIANATKRMKEAGFIILATQDWHPANHISFFINAKNISIICTKDNHRLFLVNNAWRAFNRAACVKPPNQFSLAVKHIKLAVIASKNNLGVIILI